MSINKHRLTLLRYLVTSRDATCAPPAPLPLPSPPFKPEAECRPESASITTGFRYSRARRRSIALQEGTVSAAAKLRSTGVGAASTVAAKSGWLWGRLGLGGPGRRRPKAE